MSVYVRLSSKSRKIGRVRELKDYILDPKKNSSGILPFTGNGHRKCI